MITHPPVRSPAREERMPEPRYKSTLDMPYDLFVRFKRITQERGETMRDIILKAIEEYVAKHENEKESRK